VREPKVYHESLGERKMTGFAKGEREKFYEKCRKLGQNQAEALETYRACIRWRV